MRKRDEAGREFLEFGVYGKRAGQPQGEFGNGQGNAASAPSCVTPIGRSLPGAWKTWQR